MCSAQPKDDETAVAEPLTMPPGLNALLGAGQGSGGDPPDKKPWKGVLAKFHLRMLRSNAPICIYIYIYTRTHLYL